MKRRIPFLSNFTSRESEIGQYLCFVDRRNLFNHFEFHDRLSLNQQVETVTLVQTNLFVHQWQGFLSFNG